MRQVERAVTSTDRAENESSERDREQSDAAERLVERLRRCVGDGVEVQSRGDGFAIQLLAASLGDAELIVARLADRA